MELPQFGFVICGVIALQLRLINASVSLILITVATEETDGFLRFSRSVRKYGLDVRVIGKDVEWRGGNIKYSAGGGHKVNLLRDALRQYKDDDNIILFTDSYDVVLDASAEEIISRFHRFNAKIVFSAEGYCWPDRSLAVQYPIVISGKRYLNSGGFIGYAPAIYQLVNYSPLKDDDDDQLFYTNAFLNGSLRNDLGIKLDSTSKIFQNLNGATDDIALVVGTEGVSVKNTAYNTFPIIIHGNGASKDFLNYLGNYVGKFWSPHDCFACSEENFMLSPVDDEQPTVLYAVFIEKPTTFISKFFERLFDQLYPKWKVHLFVHNKESRHADDIKQILLSAKNFASVTLLNADENISERDARNTAINIALKLNARYLFALDSDAHLTNPLSLRLLMEQNRPFVAPMLARPTKLWSNFWGALSQDGFYARSDDYVEIVQQKRRGLWNVPYVNSAYLIKAERLAKLRVAYTYNSEVDADMSFSQFNRDNGFFMYINNQHAFGHLINADHFDTLHLHNDLYQMFDNRLDWESRYIHENYSKVLDPEFVLEQPCPDVYWFPVLSETFCHELIEEMEHFGKWSDGTNTDHRLDGGYENVPTRDIHMNQVGLEKTWLHFLDEYIRPVQEKVYSGYFSVPPKATMNFVVRYKPGEQDHLRPHHDASTYTININLNRPDIDYQGGGARFIRYDCSVVNLRQGWALMHPGRLTHYHEGLKTTNGTRYIMVSFIDP